MSLHLFVALLSIGTGILDVTAFLVVGEAFASVMTGNLVILGLALGSWSGEWALFTGVAVAGYIVGGLAGSALAGSKDVEEGDPGEGTRRLLRALVTELLVLVALFAVWLWQDGEPSRTWGLVILGVAAAAMGGQGAAVRALPVQVSTTYLTGALTTVLEAVVTGRRLSPSEIGAVVAFVGLIGGSALGAVALLELRTWTLAIPVITLALAVAVMAVDLQRHNASRHGRRLT